MADAQYGIALELPLLRAAERVITLHADDYWYGGQTTIRFVHRTTIGLSANDY